MLINTDLSEIIFSISKALHISSNGIQNHHYTVALISLAIAEEMNLKTDDLNLLFLAALVHDAGVISKREGSLLLEFEDKYPSKHCKNGNEIFEKSKYTNKIAKVLLYHHDRWEGPNVSGLQGEDIPLLSTIIYLADRVAALLESKDKFVLHCSKEIIHKIESNSGKLFNPQVVKAFLQVCKKESFWFDLQPEVIGEIVNYKKPTISISLYPEELIEIAYSFSRIIDYKSPYTYQHSHKVALVSEFIAKKLNFTSYEITMLKVAGYLHDLGKISVPNDILDKPARLTNDEFQIIKRHTYFTYHVLRNIPGFELISKWGLYHHEKLDGTGYPYMLKEEQIPLGSKIIATSDVFVALTEDRPYRKGMGKTECLTTLEDCVTKKAIDNNLFKLVKQNYTELIKVIQPTQLVQINI